MGFSAHIIADSTYRAHMGVQGAPIDFRLTTLEVVVPRIVLAEFNTHRLFSRNSASSRAIPWKTMVERVMTDPFIPESWGKNQKGMSASVDLTPLEQEKAVSEWLRARDNAVEAGNRIAVDLDVHKQIANRLLETWLWHTILVSSTEWSNWTGLRANSKAQPEIQKPARLIRSAMQESVPMQFGNGFNNSRYHLPFVDADEVHESAIKDASVGRCAAVTYMRHQKKDYPADTARAQMLQSNGHMSPFEHVARPMNPVELEAYARYWAVSPNGVRHIWMDKGTQPSAGWSLEVDYFCGNYNGWIQYRKELPYEHDFSRVHGEKE